MLVTFSNLQRSLAKRSQKHILFAFMGLQLLNSQHLSFISTHFFHSNWWLLGGWQLISICLYYGAVNFKVSPVAMMLQWVVG